MRKLKLVLTISTAALAMAAIIFVTSCKKSNNTTDAVATNYASDQAVAEKSYGDAQTISESAYSNGSGAMNYRTTGITGYGCATVSTTSGGGMDTMTINFGSTNCVCHDNRSRRGEIIVTYPAGKWDSVGTTRTITFNNFYQDDNAIAGTKTVTYNGLNGSGQPYYSVVINGTVTYPSGKVITVAWTRTRTWVAGYDPSGSIVWSNVVYTISGSGTMTSSLGQQVDVNIASSAPLYFAFDCQWIEAGTISYTLVADGKTRSLNYGNTPNCDDNATITLANGTTRSIILP